MPKADEGELEALCQALTPGGLEVTTESPPNFSIVLLPCLACMLRRSILEMNSLWFAKSKGSRCSYLRSRMSKASAPEASFIQEELEKSARKERGLLFTVSRITV